MTQRVGCKSFVLLRLAASEGVSTHSFTLFATCLRANVYLHVHFGRFVRVNTATKAPFPTDAMPNAISAH